MLANMLARIRTKDEYSNLNTIHGPEQLCVSPPLGGGWGGVFVVSVLNRFVLPWSTLRAPPRSALLSG